MSHAALPTYEQHPLAIALMPGGMDEPEFEAFCEDIAQRGILFPGTLYEGKVLDGWHRYRASHRTGTRMKFVEYEGKDPAGYIAAVNVLRRKLSSLQRALVGARLHRDHGLSQRDVCKKLGISNEVVTLVLKAMDAKNTRLLKRIEAEADFTRGMLREELEDSGVLRAKKADHEMPAAPASVFLNPAALMASATDGIGDEEEEDDEEEETLDPIPKGRAAAERASKRPEKTAAQLLSEQYTALMDAEKVTFLQMIWPTAGKLVEKHKIGVAAKKVKGVDSDAAVEAMLATPKRGAKKQPTAH